MISTSKKKLLMYAHYYIPDVASTGQICADLAEGLTSSFDVTVICVVPSYSGKIDKQYKEKHKLYYKEEINGVHVIRVAVPEFSKQSKISRVKNIFTYFLNARKATKKLGKFDIVFSISQPPILGGMLGVYGKRKNHAKFVYNIQDFNPEQIMAVEYSKNKPILDLMMKIDKKSCIQSDLIITVGKDLVDTIYKRFSKNKKKPKTVMINNWIDDKGIYPLPSNDPSVCSFKNKYYLNDRFVFMYSGNIGLYYDLDNVFLAIKNIKPGTLTMDGREIVFVFVGSGSLLSHLKTIKNQSVMSNVIFIPYQDKKNLNACLNAADVHFCTNAKGIKGVSCPSKYYGIAACGKPVIGVLEKGTEIRDLIERVGGGLCSNPQDIALLTDNIKRIVSFSKSDLGNMGLKNYLLIKNNFTKQYSIEKYRTEIEDL